MFRSVTADGWTSLLVEFSSSQIMLCRLLILSCTGLFWSSAQETAATQQDLPAAPEQDAITNKPLIEKLDEGRYRIGKVTLNPVTREIRLPARVNMDKGLLEFLLVLEKGKIHESLLVTDASPSHLHLAFSLLRYPPSVELFPMLDEIGHVTGEYPDVPVEVRARARVLIDVEWSRDGMLIRNSINEWIQHSTSSQAMPPGPWIFSGSAFQRGSYIPDLTGDIAAIFVARAAMINYPSAGNDNDLVWHAFSKHVPATGSAVTLVFKPWAKPAPAP